MLIYVATLIGGTVGLIINCKHDLLFHLSTPWVHLYNLASLAVKFQAFIYVRWLAQPEIVPSNLETCSPCMEFTSFPENDNNPILYLQKDSGSFSHTYR